MSVGEFPTTRIYAGKSEIGDLRLVWFVVGTVVVTVLASKVLSGPDLLTFDLAAVYAVGAIGLNVIYGLGGLLSIAQAATMAVGAYTLVLTLNHWSVGVVPAMMLASLLGALSSGITGLLSIRVRSHYFILASIALAEGVVLIITNDIALTGGSNGLALARGAILYGLSLTNPHGFVLVAGPLTGLVWYLAASLRESRFGIALHAARSDDYLALASAIPVNRYRLWATVVGGAFGGLAGGMLALLDGYIGPQEFGVESAVLLLLMVVFGGAASNGGTVVAAIVLTVITQRLITVTSIGDLVYGVAIIALLIFAKDGLSGLGQVLCRQGSKWLSPGIRRVRHG